MKKKLRGHGRPAEGAPGEHSPNREAQNAVTRGLFDCDLWICWPIAAVWLRKTVTTGNGIAQQHAFRGAHGKTRWIATPAGLFFEGQAVSSRVLKSGRAPALNSPPNVERSRVPRSLRLLRPLSSFLVFDFLRQLVPAVCNGHEQLSC